MGDVSMLQVAVRHLRALWPAARIHVLTDVPEALANQCPDVSPLSQDGRRLWFSDQALLGNLDRHVPGGLRAVKRGLGRWLRRRWPGALDRVQRWKAQLRHRGDDRKKSFLGQMGQVDLYVVSGAALLTDKGTSHAVIVLQTIEMAIRRGVPVVMLSQGIGPLEHPDLVARARAVLPQVDLIALREGQTGPRLLESLGVPGECVMVAADDAVELARSAPAQVSRPGLGVNLRVARSTDIDAGLVPAIRSVVQDAARRLGAPLVPVPIAFHASADDPGTIRELLAGLEDDSDGGRRLETPREVIEQAGRCRIVVTAAYHAAVFALSQGVPVIALAANEYYRLKFQGLADQFGVGLEMVDLQSASLRQDLAAAIERTWDAADALRPKLRQAASRQVERIASAYQRVGQIVNASQAATRAAAR
jgi:polysaccharide pyruvyl transferase WcaK-like protein